MANFLNQQKYFMDEVLPTAAPVPSHLSDLQNMAAFVDSIDPLSGPNLMRHSNLRDNGDGTVSFMRPVPYIGRIAGMAK